MSLTPAHQLPADKKALALDERDSLVRRAAWRVIEQDSYSDSYTDESYYTQYPVAVYDDYVIVRIGTLFFKATYVVTDQGITLQAREDWSQVEQWVEAATTSAIKSISIKSKADDVITVVGRGLLYGEFDLYGDTFDADTDYQLDLVPNKPVFYDHTLQNVKHKLGTITSVKADDKGLWIEAQLDRNAEYVDEVLKLIEQGALGWSSGSIAHLIRKDGSTIKSWPVVEWSLTPTPAEPRTLGVSQIKAAPQAAEKTLGESVESAHATSPSDPQSESQGTTSTMEDTTNGAIDAASLKSAIDEGVKSALQGMPPVHAAGFITPEAQAAEKANSEAIKSFGIYLRTGVKTAMVEGVGVNGGYAVPTLYSNELVVSLRDVSILRAAGARVMEVSGTNSFHVPALGNTTAAVLTAENAPYNEQEPTLGDIEFKPYKYTRITKVSEELLADSRFDVMRTILLPDVTQAFAAAENGAFTLGTGVGQPQGVVTGASAGVTAASATAITADELLSLFYSLPAQYRANATWLLNDASIAAIRKLKTTAGDYIWAMGLAGQPDTIMGRPVQYLNSMDTIATGKKTVVFGDLSYFWIADFGGLETQRLNELYSATGQIGFRWFKRFDSHVVLPEAIKTLTQA